VEFVVLIYTLFLCLLCDFTSCKKAFFLDDSPEHELLNRKYSNPNMSVAGAALLINAGAKNYASLA
jgi:hypothetical protein